MKEDKGLTIICKKSVIVVPSNLRDKLLHQHHQGHPGMTKMKSTLRAAVYWPGLARDVENLCCTCDACVRTGSPDVAPLKVVADQERAPWDTLAVDVTGPSESTDGVTLFTVIDCLILTFPLRLRSPGSNLYCCHLLS